DQPIIDAAPLKNGVPLGRGAVDMDLSTGLLQFPEQTDQLVTMNVDSVLEAQVWLVGVESEIELGSSHRTDRALPLRIAVCDRRDDVRLATTKQVGDLGRGKYVLHDRRDIRRLLRDVRRIDADLSKLLRI